MNNNHMPVNLSLFSAWNSPKKGITNKSYGRKSINSSELP